MAESNAVKSYRLGTILLEDGTTPTALSYTVTIEEGNFTFADPKDNRTIVRDRGAIVGLIAGDEQIKSGSFSAHFREFTNAVADGTLIDFIENTGAYAAAVTTGGIESKLILKKITFTVEGTNCGDAADHVLTLNDVFLVWDFAEGETDVINVTFEVYGTVTRTGPI